MARSETNLFGWCMTGHCKACKTSFTFYDKTITCECKCHTKDKK